MTCLLVFYYFEDKQEKKFKEKNCLVFLKNYLKNFHLCVWKN